MDNFLNDIFTAFQSQDSVAFLLFMLFSFLLGYVIAAIGYGWKIRKLRKKLRIYENNTSKNN